MPLSRPLHLCSKKPNIFAFPFHKYPTYSPVRCTDRLPHPTRSMLSKKIRVVPPLSKKRRLCVSLPSFCTTWRYFTYKISPWTPLYDPPRGLAYFCSSRGVPAYSQCPRSTKGDRCVSRYLQYPHSKICYIYHNRCPQDFRLNWPQNAKNDLPQKNASFLVP